MPLESSDTAIHYCCFGNFKQMLAALCALITYFRCDGPGFYEHVLTPV